MSTLSNYSLSPLKPYDDIIYEQLSIYDSMPYEWDMNSERCLTLVSGNVIKGYRCKINEPYEIKH